MSRRARYDQLHFRLSGPPVQVPHDGVENAAGTHRRSPAKFEGENVVFDTADLVTDLPRVLDLRRDEIATAWSAAVRRLPSPRYAGQADAELQEMMRQGLGAMSRAIAAGSYAPLDDYLAKLSAIRYAQGFDTGEVIEGLLLWRETAIRAVKRSYQPDSRESYAAVGQLDPYLRYLISRFSQLYSLAINRDLREQEQRSTAMLAENARLFEETRQRLVQTLSLQRITNAILERQPLGDVLHLVCGEAVSQLGAEGAALLALNEDGELSEAMCLGRQGDARSTAFMSRMRRVVDENRPLLLAAERTTTPGDNLLAVPLRARQSVIGVLMVCGRPSTFSDEDARLAQMLADQAAVAIENTRLQEQADRLAVIEERQRLARELHDSVTQSLYSTALYAEAAGRMLAGGQVAVAANHLHEVREIAQEALREMRLLIFELRPPVLEKEGLVAALQARLDAVEARGGLKTEFRVYGEDHLLPALQEELYRIAQEALNNVLKHAKASRVAVLLSIDEERVEMEIMDDGVGFVPDGQSRQGGLGLRGMRERAGRIGGVLEVTSAVGEGTRVRLTVPRRDGQ